MMRRLLHALLLLGWAVAGHAGEEVHCERVVAVGDLHGGYGAFVSILQETRLLDEELRWQDGRACLVQLGDTVDRGPRSREVLDLLIDLDRQAPGRVTPLLGNHEVMNMIGDLRYVHEGEFAAFAGEETEQQRRSGLAAFLQTQLAADLDPGEVERRFDTLFPPGWFAHRQAFSPAGRYGSWLLRHRTLTIVNDTLFVHGGISVDDARVGIESLNEQVRRDLLDYQRQRDTLIECGWLGPLDTYETSLRKLYGPMQVASKHDTRRAAAAALLESVENILMRSDGPLWNRDLALKNANALDHDVDEILRALDVQRIVVAHTPGPRIRSRSADRVFVIDTGAGPAYGGQVSALEIGGGRVTAVYAGTSQLLWDLLASDSGIERILGRGEIVQVTEIGSGSTRPRRVDFELEGRRASAAFKALDVARPGLEERLKDPGKHIIPDSFRYERAAYLLDRQLGMDMVPVVVLREVRGDPGALVQWIPEALTEEDRRERGLETDDPQRLRDQLALTQLFDALIANADRDLRDLLYTRPDWKLHLIDHGRGFRLNRRLPESFQNGTIRLPREMLPRLEALDQATLSEVVGDLLTRAEIRALLARRDRILKKIEADRAARGDARVFFGSASGPQSRTGSSPPVGAATDQQVER